MKNVKSRKRLFLFAGSIILGMLGFLPSLLSVYKRNIDDELTPDYYSNRNEELFKRKNDKNRIDE